MCVTGKPGGCYSCLNYFREVLFFKFIKGGVPMETKIRAELEKAVLSDDMLGFRDELVKKISSKIMTLSLEELWPVFLKAAGNSTIEWESLTEPVYDDGIDYSSRTRRFKSLVIDHFVDEIIGFIRKRRGSLRFDFKKEVDVYPSESMVVEPFSAWSENISAGGLLISSGTPFQKGEKLELRVHTRETAEPVRIFGSVVRSEQSLPSVFDVGVYINTISEHDGEAGRSTAEAVYRISQMGHK